jgi:hypothetical protein
MGKPEFTLIVVGERRFYDPFCHFNLVARLLVCEGTTSGSSFGTSTSPVILFDIRLLYTFLGMKRTSLVAVLQDLLLIVELNHFLQEFKRKDMEGEYDLFYP